MGIIVNDFRGLHEVSAAAYGLRSRNIFLNGEINEDMANSFLWQMLYLSQEAPEKDINIFLNSSGGEVVSGLMIADILLNTKMQVNIYCTGIAASMAAVLLSCGKNRYIFPNAKTMIHEPLISGAFCQKAGSLQDMSQSLMKIREKLNSLLAQRTGKTIEVINEVTAQERYMTAFESVEFGLCDEVKIVEI